MEIQHNKIELQVLSPADVDIEEFGFSKLKEEQLPQLKEIESVDDDDRNALASTGVLLANNAPRSGTYLLHGHDALTTSPIDQGMECLPIAIALKKYEWLREKYWFKLVAPEKDEFTSAVATTVPRGFFIHVKKGVKVELPFQTGLFMNKQNDSMGVHNVVILEEDAELHLITGCTTGCSINRGLHLAITEAFVGKNASLTNTMIHSWGPDFVVRPRAATTVQEGGRFVSNYISLRQAKSMQMDPITHLIGDDSSVTYNSVILAGLGTHSDLGGTVLLDGANSNAEIVSRAVCHGGIVKQTGLLVGKGANSRAHVECSGLMLSDEGSIEAVPGLRSMHPDAMMSHEASIGRISPGEVAYLQTRGFTEEEARSLIVRGFVSIDAAPISPELDKAVRDIAEISGHGEE